MGDYFKDLFQAWGDRIRSPFFGSILISFCLINWKALFYLLFAEKPVRMRILYFEENTDLMSLAWLPLVSGLGLALVFPWAAVVGAWMAKLPRAKLHSIQFSEASKRRITEYEEEAREEEAKARLEAASEQRKIDAAKRLEEAGSVSDKLEAEITVERKRDAKPREGSSLFNAFKELSELEIKILLGAAESPSGLVLMAEDKVMFQNSPTHDFEVENHRREKIRIANAFETLEKNGYFSKTKVLNGKLSGIEYQMEENGYALAEYVLNNTPF